MEAAHAPLSLHLSRCHIVGNRVMAQFFYRLFQWMTMRVRVRNLQYEMGIFTTGLRLNWCVLSQGWPSLDWYGIVLHMSCVNSLPIYI